MPTLRGLTSHRHAHSGSAYNKKKLNLYLRYLTAARSFERWATPLTVHSIDQLVDEIVHQGDVEDVDSEEPVPSDLAMNLVSSVEEFFLAHELAHLLLQHGADGSTAAEAAADRKALEMLGALDHSNFGYFEIADLEPRHIPQLGYLTLRMWTAVRLVSEQRILPWVHDSADDIVEQHAKIAAVWEARSKQAEMVGILNTLETPPVLHQVTRGMSLLVDEINSTELDGNEIARIGRLARSLATENYDELIARYRIPV